MLMTPELQKRLERLVTEGYMLRFGPDFSRCVLTDKGMTVLLADADSPILVSKLSKPSLAFERQRTDAYRARQQGNF